jgi:cytosine/adenosine deaminase-related metal-dependent hydrolase
MPPRHDILLKNATVVDPVNIRNAVMDVAVADGKIAEITTEMNPELAREWVDLSGFYLIPGIIDLHVHASSWLGGRYGHKMMALAGVTTALDMSGPVDSVVDMAKNYGVGLNLACLQYVRPGYTVKTTNPDRSEIEKLLAESRAKGAIGLKILGGHYPLTPEATARIIDTAHRENAYLAFHAGTLNTQSDIDGFHEALALTRGTPIHLAHINSYCRGTVRPSMAEAEEAIEALKRHRHVCSESYLSPMNGTSAKCVNGIPESQVTNRCLTAGGYPESEKGLEAAIIDGWAQINMESGGSIVLASGEKALKWWQDHATDTTVSFRVNPEIPRLRLASAKKDSGEFVVDCISTDGGGIPRNVTVEMGLSLVKLQVLSMADFVVKTSRNPAEILGLKNKGHLSIGADADISVLDLTSQKPVMSLSNGKVIMRKGQVCGQGCRMITTPAGKKRIKAEGLQTCVVDPEKTSFFRI